MKLEGGIKDADHWGVYGPRTMSSRGLPPQLKQMQPTGRREEQGDEGRRRALEAATVARAEGDDWGSIAQSLRESPGAAGPLSSEERRQAEVQAAARDSWFGNPRISGTPRPFDSELSEELACIVYGQENRHRVLKANAGLSVRQGTEDASTR
jgi:hypothetical protein